MVFSIETLECLLHYDFNKRGGITDLCFGGGLGQLLLREIKILWSSWNPIAVWLSRSLQNYVKQVQLLVSSSHSSVILCSGDFSYFLRWTMGTFFHWQCFATLSFAGYFSKLFWHLVHLLAQCMQEWTLPLGLPSSRLWLLMVKWAVGIFLLILSCWWLMVVIKALTVLFVTLQTEPRTKV